MDGDAPSRLVVLVERITNKRNPALDTSLLAEIKALCKLGDEHVLLAFDAVYSQLRATHAQTRLLALLLCEQLFLRSRVFRLALISHLSQFLEAVLGHREERPLPPPPAAAAALRAKGLELLGRWEAQYGRRYRQLSLANKYLRETARVQQLTPVPPGVAAAEAERAARERQQRAADHTRLAALLGGPGEEGRGEWEEGAAAARQLLTELLECFAILEEQRQARQAQQAAAAAAEQAAAAAGLEWEDIAADAGGAAEQQQHAAGVLKPLQQDEEGLAAYGAAAADNGGGGATLDSRGAGGAGGGGGAGEEEDAVLETLAGLYRQLANRVLPQLADWLSVLGRSEGSDGRQEAARQRALRETTALRSRLAAAKERCDALDLDLQALLLRRLRHERERLRQSERRDTQPAAQQPQQQQQQQQQQQPGHQRQQEAAQEQGQQRGQPAAQQFTRQDEPAVASALQELFGESDGEGDEEERGGSAAAGTTASQQQQQQRGSAAARSTAAAAGDEDFESPYLKIVDPAAPRPRSAAAAAPQPRQQPGGSSAAVAAGSSLPEEVRKKLAAQAPVLPSGLHTIFWDSKSGPAYVSGHGLEVSNHWGPVDVHRELPQERLDEIFMIPMPAAAQHRQQQQQSQQRQAQREGQVAAAPAVAGQRQPRQLSSQGEAGSSGAATRPWPRRREHDAADGAGPSAAAQDTAAPPAAPTAPAGDARVAKRARRAQERAYNEAVIGGADPDAALARQLQDSEAHAGAGGQHANDDAQRGRGGPPGQRGAAPRKMTVQARLAAKLLRGRALAAAVADETRTESEARRDKFGNRW